MNDARITVSRPMVGICALICLLGAAGVWVFEPRPAADSEHTANAEKSQSASSTQWSLIKGAFTRVGLVMGALWIALPSGRRRVDVSPKALLVGLVAVVGVVVKPRFFIPLLIVMAVLAKILRPKEKNRKQASLTENTGLNRTEARC
ncbi:MAG: hypothetical protein ACE5KM_23890, partial [Planctomycetaceae bacterium]